MEWNKLTSSSGVQTKTSSVDAIFDSVLTISMRRLQVCWKNILKIAGAFFRFEKFRGLLKTHEFSPGDST